MSHPKTMLSANEVKKAWGLSDAEFQKIREQWLDRMAFFNIAGVNTYLQLHNIRLPKLRGDNAESIYYNTEKPEGTITRPELKKMLDCEEAEFQRYERAGLTMCRHDERLPITTLSSSGRKNHSNVILYKETETMNWLKKHGIIKEDK